MSQSCARYCNPALFVLPSFLCQVQAVYFLHYYYVCTRAWKYEMSICMGSPSICVILIYKYCILSTHVLMNNKTPPSYLPVCIHSFIVFIHSFNLHYLYPSLTYEFLNHRKLAFSRSHFKYCNMHLVSSSWGLGLPVDIC